MGYGLGLGLRLARYIGGFFKSGPPDLYGELIGYVTDSIWGTPVSGTSVGTHIRSLISGNIINTSLNAAGGYCIIKGYRTCHLD